MEVSGDVEAVKMASGRILTDCVVLVAPVGGHKMRVRFLLRPGTHPVVTRTENGLRLTVEEFSRNTFTERFMLHLRC